jgi:transmembrane sensor
MSQSARDINDLDPLTRDALAWMMRLTSGDATGEDAEALRIWRNQSPDHEAAYRAAVRLWKAAGNAIAGAAPAHDRPSSWATFFRYAAVAASLACLVVLGLQQIFGPSFAELNADYRTRIGERRQVTLADGSVTDMNTGSSLSVQFGAAERRIDLVAGEAVFAVRSDPDRPFVVTAGNGRTTAIGTVFAVRHEEARIVVTCLEGLIEVASGPGPAARATAGQQVVYGGSGVTGSGPVAADITTATAWQKGLLVFRDMPMRRVVDELNRYRRGRIVIANGDLADRRVSGVFHLDRPDEVLSHAERTLGFHQTDITQALTILY